MNPTKTCVCEQDDMTRLMHYWGSLERENIRNGYAQEKNIQKVYFVSAMYNNSVFVIVP